MAAVAPLSAGPIPLSPTLARFLVAAAAAPKREAFTPTRTTVSLTWLLEVEETRDATLPWDVIALSTLCIPIVRDYVGFWIDALMSPRESCQEESRALPRGWIGIASFGWVLDEALTIDTMLGVARQRDCRDGDPALTMIDRHGERHATTLSDLLWERLGKALDAKRGVDDAAVEVPAGYVVTIVDDLPVATTPVAVTHAKFGPGTIVEELGDGKVRVAFESGDVRVLLRRFLGER